MNFLYWIWVIEKIEKEEEDDIPLVFTTYNTETRWDKFCKRHPIIDKVWPYVLGIGIGLVPFFIGYALPKLLGVF